MRYRTFGRTGWQVSEIGYGMWGMGGWTGSDDEESLRALDRAVELGCNFFDTAWAYGEGNSEQLLGEALRAPPRRAGLRRDEDPAEEHEVAGQGRVPGRSDVYPPTTSASYTEKSLENLGVPSDRPAAVPRLERRWAEDDGWQRAVDDLKREGLVRVVGISVNRWEATNVMRRARRPGSIDSVQVVYNIFDQAPEDELFPVLPGARHRASSRACRSTRAA